VIRGLGGDRVLVLEDGARVGDLSSTSGDHALSVDPLNAERIEVVRGPAALLYGSNAIGGVINVIRDEVPSALPDRPTGVLTMQGQSANVGVGAGGSGSRAGQIRAARGGQLSQRRVTCARRMACWTTRACARTRWLPALRTSAQTATPALPTATTTTRTASPAVSSARIRSAWTWRCGGTRCRRRRTCGDGSGRSAAWTYTRTTRTTTTASWRRDIIGTEFGLLTAAGELVARHAGRGLRSSGALGTRIAWQDFQAAGMETPPTHEVAARCSPLRSWVQAGCGSRAVSGSTGTGSRRARRRACRSGQPTGRDPSRRYRLRSVRSTSWRRGSAPARVLPGRIARRTRPSCSRAGRTWPRIHTRSATRAWQAEVGHGLDAFVRLAGERVTGEVTLFRNALDNYIYYRDTGEREPETQLPIWRATGTDAVLDGFEVAGSAEILRYLVVSGVASYVRGTRAADDAPLPLIPPLHGQVGARYDRPSYFAGLAWRGAAAQERVATDEFEPATPGYAVLDLEAGLRWVALGRVQSVTVRVENATNDVVYDHMSRIRERDTGSGGERRAPGPGRGVSMVYRMVF
jgi:iron complex outermembrane recepter protein